MTANIIAIIALLLLSSFFSATETAFTSFNKIKIKNLASDDNKTAKMVLRLSEQYDKLLSTILVGNNIANICLTSVATVLCVSMYGSNLGATIATIAVTITVLIFGEISPKTIAKDRADSFVMLTARIVNFLLLILTPITFIFHGLQKLLSKLIRKTGENSFNEDELITIVEEAKTEGTLGEEQSELITNAIEFNDVEAIDIITPRVDIVAIEKGTDPEEIKQIFKESGLSRLPVYEDDMDDIIGVLNQKDFHNNVINTAEDVDALVKPVAYVSQSLKASVLLKKMQQMKTHLAIVVDEYGGTTGLVTMEDIIEEIVGKIYDEHDAVEMREVTAIGSNAYTVSGGANLEKFFELFDEEIDADATTVNGWIMIELDRLPKVGDCFEYVSKHKIFHVRVTKADDRRALMSYIRVEERPEEDDSKMEQYREHNKR